jgi:hypothetical protein
MYGRSKVAIILAMVLVYGCSRNQSTSKNSSPVRQFTESKANPPDSQIPPAPPSDRSLESKDYLAAGVPAHDRTWQSADILRASESLHAIARRNIQSLPRYESSRSGAVFARITSKDNVDFYRSESLPLEQRLEPALNHQLATNQLLKLYLHAYNQHAVGSSELIELSNAQLRIAAVLATLVREFIPRLDPSDSTYAVRMQGLAKMRNGMATMVSGCLDTLTERHVHTAAERKRVLECLAETLPEIMRELPESSRSEFLIRLRSFQKDSTMADLEPQLSRVVGVVAELADAKLEP